MQQSKRIEHRTMWQRWLAAAITSVFIPVAADARQVTATVYGAEFAGGPNYCDGSTYDHWGVSAASSWLPCHSKVQVTHKGRVLTVYIKDRCHSCDLDLSAGAAYKLGVPLDGIATVSIWY